MHKPALLPFLRYQGLLSSILAHFCRTNSSYVLQSNSTNGQEIGFYCRIKLTNPDHSWGSRWLQHNHSSGSKFLASHQGVLALNTVISRLRLHDLQIWEASKSSPLYVSITFAQYRISENLGRIIPAEALIKRFDCSKQWFHQVQTFSYLSENIQNMSMTNHGVSCISKSCTEFRIFLRDHSPTLIIW